MSVPVIALPGGVMPAAIRYAPLKAAVHGQADFHFKDLEVYAGDAPAPGYSITTEVEALARFADSLGLERFHLVGYSGGGFVSLAFAGTMKGNDLYVVDLKAGGLGNLGAEQLAWLEADLKDKSNSTPIVVFAHIPLQVIYKEWGWGTEDGMQALNLLKRFGSVTVLNGHIHQLAQKVEGNMTFHTALSTAFPQPAPGSAPSPGPMVVPADQLRSVLGLSTVTVVQGNKQLAIVDKTLAG